MSQISLLNLWIADQIGCRAREEDLPGLEHIAVVGDAECHVRILLDQQDGRSIGTDALDDFEDFLNNEWRQTERGLVQNQQLWP